MSFWRLLGDPGPCPICGVPHSSCTGDGPSMVVEQRPASAANARARLTTTQDAAIAATLAPGMFTTATYSRRAGRPAAPRPRTTNVVSPPGHAPGVPSAVKATTRQESDGAAPPTGNQDRKTT